MDLSFIKTYSKLLESYQILLTLFLFSTQEQINVVFFSFTNYP